MGLIWMLMSLAVIAGIASCQTFDVASIRPSGVKSTRGSEGGPGTKDPTRYTFGRATLDDLFLLAYHVEMFQISSKLPLDRDEFDLAVNLPQGATKDEFRAMLRNLMVDRFQMKAHMESREFPAFEMVLAKSGTKLGTDAAKKLLTEDGFPTLAPGKPGLTGQNSTLHGRMLTRIRGQSQPVSRLAEILGTAEPRPIVDKTGLSGRYDFALEFSSDLPNTGIAADMEPPAAPDLNTALREQLGLQLVARKLPFDVVVIDSFDRLPVGN